MELKLLAEHPEAIPIIARWYADEWGHLSEANTFANMTKSLHTYLNTDKIPLMVLAIDKGEILGVSQLKFREMSIYPDKEHWLGGVYVAETHRGKGVAEQIVKSVIAIATTLGVHKLNLQTEHLDGGLYKRLGWQPIEQVNYDGVDVVVMEKEIHV